MSLITNPELLAYFENRVARTAELFDVELPAARQTILIERQDRPPERVVAAGATPTSLVYPPTKTICADSLRGASRPRTRSNFLDAKRRLGRLHPQAKRRDALRSMRALFASGARTSFSRFTSRTVFSPCVRAAPSAARDELFDRERDPPADMLVRAFKVNFDSTAQILNVHRAGRTRVVSCASAPRSPRGRFLFGRPRPVIALGTSRFYLLLINSAELAGRAEPS
jgi:hypothetical protein